MTRIQNKPVNNQNHGTYLLEKLIDTFEGDDIDIFTISVSYFAGYCQRHKSSIIPVFITSKAEQD